MKKKSLGTHLIAELWSVKIKQDKKEWKKILFAFFQYYLDVKNINYKNHAEQPAFIPEHVSEREENRRGGERGNLSAALVVHKSVVNTSDYEEEVNRFRQSRNSQPYLKREENENQAGEYSVPFIEYDTAYPVKVK